MKDLPKQFIEDFKKLISIPSVYENSDDYPFGKPIDDCLTAALEIASNLGFSTYKDPEGYYGYAEVGSGETLIGVLGHLDVVPVGDLKSWSSNPFELTESNKRLYGRGTQDDKGPMLISMYALKNLIDNGIILNKRVRFIFGTDEETLWRGIAKYNEKEDKPSFGFTPDSAFPLTYAEKGLLQFNIKGKGNSQIKLSGGDAYNAVPSQMSYNDVNIDEVKKALDNRQFNYNTNTDNSITVLGKSMHAKDAHLGVNSITRLAIALNDIDTQSNLIKFIAQVIGEDAHATNIFGDIEDEDTGKISFNIGKIEITENQEIINVDMRLPINTTKGYIEDKLKESLKPYNLEYEYFDWLNSVYIPKGSKLILDLIESYQSVTGDTASEPMASGGATYARAIDNCVAFGALFPQSEKTEHQANENIEIKDIILATRVYEEAFTKLLNNEY